MKRDKILGERKIIELIVSRLDRMPTMPIPFGDDVSAYDLGNEKVAVLKTDMLVGKTDIPPGMSVWNAARKAVVMNISDFAAKGVKPLAVLVSLGLPPDITKKDIEQIGNGLNAGSREYGTFVVGGDTGEATDLIISVMVFGLAQKEEVVLRSGAKPGDILAVTGLFGKTSAGLRLLLGDHKASKSVQSVLVDSVYMPSARLPEGLALAQSKGVSASIDSSDGLAWSLREMGQASHVGFVINYVPVAEEAKKFAIANKLDVWDLTFYGGEEYELVVTVKPESWKKAECAVKNAGGQLLRIGRVIADKEIFAEVGRERRNIEPRGYEHLIR